MNMLNVNENANPRRMNAGYPVSYSRQELEAVLPQIETGSAWEPDEPREAPRQREYGPRLSFALKLSAAIGVLVLMGVIAVTIVAINPQYAVYGALETHIHGDVAYSAPKDWELVAERWPSSGTWRVSGDSDIWYSYETESTKWLYVCDSNPDICFDVEFVDRHGDYPDGIVHDADQSYYFCYQSREDFDMQHVRQEKEVNGIPVIEYLYTRRDDRVGAILQITRYYLHADGWARVTAWCPEYEKFAVWDSLMDLENSVQMVSG